MDEIWERAVESALDGQTDADFVRTLTLDGAVKCAHGRLPAPSLFDKFLNLQHLSMANIGVSSLEHFPTLRNLQRLILSDNRISGGLQFLVAAGLESLRDLDLSNNRISNVGDLRPLADLRLVSLDLYECPVTRVKDYRSRVFGLIRTLKYLDKMDSEGNERPESDDEEEEEEEDEPGSGEIDGGDHPSRLSNGHPAENDVIVDADEDEESDADEEEAETSRGLVNGNVHQHSNGFRVEAAGGGHEGEEERDSVEEVYEDDEGEDEDVAEVHEIVGSDDDDEDNEDEEEVDNEERDFEGTESTSRLASTEGEIDGHEQGEDDADEDDNGETGEEELAVDEDVEFEDEEEAEDEEDDYGSSSGYLVQPVGRVQVDAGVDEDDPEMEEEEDDGEVQELPPSSTKRKRSDDDDSDDGGDENENEDGHGDEDDDEEDVVQQYSKSSSKDG